MNTRTTALQLGRIVVLLVLLRATGWYADNRTQRTPQLDTGGLWGPWAVVSLVSALFVAVLLIGRRHRHPVPVLAAEAVLAAVLAFVPPLQWVFWFGVGEWYTSTVVGGFVQPLAMAWLGVVVAVGFHQLQAAHPPWSPRGPRSGPVAASGAAPHPAPRADPPEA